jgi:hypothetical protein
LIGQGLNRARLTALAQLNADAIATGTMPLNVHLQSGVFAGSGATVCVAAAQLIGGGFGIADVERVQLQGYLIPE